MHSSKYSPVIFLHFFFSSRRRHTRWPRDWSSDVCSSDLGLERTVGVPPSITKRPGSMQRSHAAAVERDAELVGPVGHELEEAHADAAGPAQRAALGVVEDVVVLDLAAHDDARVAVGDLEADAHLAAQRRHRRRLDQHAADRDVACDRADLAVVLAGQRDLENLVESNGCPLLARTWTGHEWDYLLPYPTWPVPGPHAKVPGMRRPLLLLALLAAVPARAQEAAAPWIGIAIAEGEKGVLVSQVLDGTPAQKAGLKAGDQVVTIDGVTVVKPGDLIGRVQDKGVGTKVVLGVLRGGKTETVTLALEARPDEIQLLRDHLVGRRAPAFALAEAKGPYPATLASLTGNVVVVEFWA